MTAEAIYIEQKDRAIIKALPSPEVLIGVWWRNPGAVAARNFCPGIVFLRNRAVADAWKAGDSGQRDVVTLEDAVDIGVRFFRPLLQEVPAQQLVAISGRMVRTTDMLRGCSLVSTTPMGPVWD